MDFSIVTKRTVGYHCQTAAVVYKDAPQTAGVAYSKMKAFVELFADFKPDDQEAGDLEEIGTMKQDGAGTSNTGSKGNCVIVFARAVNEDVPVQVQTTLYDVTSANVTTLIKAYFTELLNNPNAYKKYVIVGLSIRLHD